MPLTTLYVPKKPPTPRDKAVFLALGCSTQGDAYTWETLPSFPIGVAAPCFPIIILCRSEDEFLELRIVAPWIYRIAQLQLDSRQRVAEALELLRKKAILRSTLVSRRYSWPVFGGNGGLELIAFTWADAYELYVGQDDPKVGTKQTNLLDALIGFILRDVHGIDSATAAQELDDFATQLAQLQVAADPPPNTPGRCPPATPSKPNKKKVVVIESESEAEMPTPTAAKARRGPSQRAKPSRDAAAPESHADDGSTTPAAAPASPPLAQCQYDMRGPVPQAPNVISDSMPMQPEAVSADSPQSSTAPTPCGVAAAVPEHSEAGSAARRNAPASGQARNLLDHGHRMPNTWQHIRDPWGHIVHSHARWFASHEVTLPSFGVTVDGFLDAFGFADDLCFILAACYDLVEDVAQFCNIMGQCISRAEAYWLWHHIERQVALRPTRVREHSIRWD